MMKHEGKVVHSSIPAPLVFSVCLLDSLQNIRTIWTVIWILFYYVYRDLRSPASREVFPCDRLDRLNTGLFLDFCISTQCIAMSPIA